MESSQKYRKITIDWLNRYPLLLLFRQKKLGLPIAMSQRALQQMKPCYLGAGFECSSSKTGSFENVVSINEAPDNARAFHEQNMSTHSHYNFATL